MNATGHTSTPLLLLILLAILLQPLVLTRVLDVGSRGAETAPEPDAGLETAIRELTRAVNRRGATGESPVTPTDHSRLETVLSRLAEQLEAAPAVGALPPPPVEGKAVASSEPPRRQDRVDAWIEHCRELKESGEKPRPNLFFHRTKAEVLASFGVPDEAYEGASGARWIYRSPQMHGDLAISFDGDRVCQFNFW